MSRRLLLIGAAAAIWAGLSAGSASSALFFLFEPTSVDAGQLVTIRTAGTPRGFQQADRTFPLQLPIRIYLVRNAVAGKVRSRFDSGLHFVGRLVPDAKGRASLTFAAPPLDSGDYAVAAWCPGCASASGGRAFSVLQVDEQIVPVTADRCGSPSVRRSHRRVVPSHARPDRARSIATGTGCSRPGYRLPGS